jgi:undecaprenyl-diphosphatase
VNRKIALAFILMMVHAIILSFLANEFAVLPFDLKSYHELQEVRNPLFGILMKAISDLGDASIAAVLIAATMTIFALRRQWIESIFMLATATSTLLTLVLKYIIHRARPIPFAENAAGILESISQYSYPSGHVLLFVVFFGFFAYLAWMHFSGRARAIAVTVCTALIILIGPSRVFLGAHWASDVVGGYIIGTIWLFVLIFAYQRIARGKNHGPEFEL